MAELSKKDKDILAYTLLGEARGEGKKGMEAVAWVIRNRAESGQFPSSPAAVATQKGARGSHQFSAWDVPGQKFSTKEKSAALEAIDNVFSDKVPDPTNGAIGYYANKGPNAINAPSWFNKISSGGSSTQIGNHIFASPTAGDVTVKSVNPDGTDLARETSGRDNSRRLMGGAFGVDRLPGGFDKSQLVQPEDITSAFLQASADTGLAGPGEVDPRLSRLLAVQRAREREAGIDHRSTRTIQDKPSGLISRSVQSIPIDQYGQPIVPWLRYVPEDVGAGVTDQTSATDMVTQVADAGTVRNDTIDPNAAPAERANPQTSMTRRPDQRQTQDRAIGRAAVQQVAVTKNVSGSPDDRLPAPQPVEQHPAGGNTQDNTENLSRQLRANGYIDTASAPGVQEFALPAEYHPAVMDALNAQLVNSSGSPDERGNNQPSSSVLANSSGSPDERDTSGLVPQRQDVGYSGPAFKYETRLVTTDIVNPAYTTWASARNAVLGSNGRNVGGDTKEGHGAITNIQEVGPAPPPTIKKTVSVKVRVPISGVPQRVAAPILKVGTNGMVIKPPPAPMQGLSAQEVADITFGTGGSGTARGSQGTASAQGWAGF